MTIQQVALGMLGSAAPLETEIRPTDQESLLVNERFCPRLGPVLRHSQRGDEFARLATEMNSLVTVARDQFGLHAPRPASPQKGSFSPAGSTFFELADLFFAQTCHGSVKRSELGEQFCRLSRRAWDITQAELAKNPLHSRLRVGRLVEEILQAQLEVGSSQDPLPSRLVLLGAHDTTLAHLATALELPVYAWPPYASSMVIETWTTGSNGTAGTFVRFLYNGELLRVPWAEPDRDGFVPSASLMAFSRHLLQTQNECSLL